MNWYYANSGRQTGPVAEDAFEQLVAQGTVRGDTLVWHEGMPQWTPYSSLNNPMAAAPQPPAMPGVRYCGQCGSPYAPDDLVSFGGVLVCGNCKPAYTQRMREGVLPASRLDFASLWLRFGAYLLDIVILYIAASLLGVVLFAIYRPDMQDFPVILAGEVIITVFMIFLTLAYETYFVGKYGATPGKLACSIAVVRTDGSKLTYGRALGRYGAKVVNGFTMGIGYLMACFDEEKAALHDRIADTRVIRR